MTVLELKDYLNDLPNEMEIELPLAETPMYCALSPYDLSVYEYEDGTKTLQIG